MSKQKIYFCLGCGKSHARANFYKSNNELHKNGVIPFCKDFIRDYCTNLDGSPDTIKLKNLLRQVDKPFLEDEWEGALAEKERETFGAYFGRINMRHNLNKTWEDSDLAVINLEHENDAPVYSQEWLGHYTRGELNYLNNYLSNMMEDYDINTVNRLDYAKKIAKASLITDRLYSEVLEGDETANKRYKEAQKIFDDLSKSAQFAQSKHDKKEEGVSSLSEIIAKVEAEEYPYKVSPDALDRDIYDQLLDKFQNIERSLE